jgi:hypothetical protein
MVKHIVHKQKVELHVTRQEDAVALQSRVSRLLQNELREKMEKIFETLAPEEKVIRIDKLHLDLKTINAGNFEKEFEEHFIEALQTALSNIKDREQKSNVAILSTDESLLQSFIYFLQYACLPWYNSVKKIHLLEEEILHHLSANEWEQFFDWLQKNYRVHPKVLQRLINQFSNQFLLKIISKSKVIFHEAIEEVYADLCLILEAICAQKKLHSRIILWETIFYALLDSKRSDEIEKKMLNNLLKRIIKEYTIGQSAITVKKSPIVKTVNTLIVRNAFESFIESLENGMIKSYCEDGEYAPDETGSLESNEKTITGKKQSHIEEDSLYVQNCGIAILHPFLETYFEDLKLVTNKQFIGEDASKRAVLLLHYLATAETEAAEFSLVLQKILCGLSLEETLPATIELSDEEITESQKVLRAVMNYWTPLKNTSIAGLQQTFLQRDGKLMRTETGWLLQVEQKTVDILLGKLPWGFSTIYLPWMDEVVHVEWA